MKKIILILFIVVMKYGYAQHNLILNSSFENLNTCTITMNGFASTKNWYSPTNNSPDIWAKCADDILLSTPYNQAGYQFPHSGNNYAGLAIWAYPPSPIVNEKDYIQTLIESSLKKNMVYQIEMYVSCADNNNTATFIASNKLAFLFSTDSVIYKNSSQMFWGAIPRNPQIVFNHVISDTLNWVKLSATFIADSNYNYLTIGNFASQDSMIFDTICVNTLSNDALSYYFIDDVSLVEIPDTIIINNNNEMNIYNDNGSTYFNYSLAEAANNAAIEVYNTWGQKVMEYTNLQQQNTITVNNNLLSSAMYFVVLSNNNKKLITKKWVVW